MKIGTIGPLTQTSHAYIKYDTNNNPDYGFICETNNNKMNILKFINFNQKMPEYIILPYLQRAWNDPLDNIIIKKCLKKQGLTISQENMVRNYINGNIIINPFCFKGINNINLIIPDNTPVVFKPGCFDENTNINLVLSKKMALKYVCHTVDTAMKNFHENWILIGNRELTYLKPNEKVIDYYTVTNYNNEDRHIKFTIDEDHYVNGDEIKENKSMTK